MSSAAAARKVLRRVPLFEGLAGDALDGLAERARPVELDAGAVLVAEGEPAGALFVVADGLLEATEHEGDRPLRLGV